MDDINNNYDTIHRSRTFDCVGSGEANISDFLNDAVSAVWVGSYDARVGYVTVYEDSKFQGNRTNLYLSKFVSDSVISISNWRSQDRISSIDWSKLGELCQVKFYDNADGSGISYNDAFGWSSNKSISSMGDVRMNDTISSFRWSYKVPMKEVISALSLAAPTSMTVGKTYSSRLQGVNNKDTTVQFTLEISETLTDATSVTVSNSSTWGWNVSATVSYSPPGELGGVGGSFTVGFDGSKTTSTETNTTTTKTVEVKTSTVVSVGADSAYDYVLAVQVGTVPQTFFTTTATRWYDIPVSGAVKDATNNNWYKRTESLKGSFLGGFATGTTLVNNVK